VRGCIIIRVIAEEDQVPGSGTPQLILLGGLPGSGKTSLGRRVAEEIPAVRLCGDEWMARLGVDWLDEETRDRLEQLFWELAQNLLRHGQTVILESGFWLRSVLHGSGLAWWQPMAAMGIPGTSRAAGTILQDPAPYILLPARIFMGPFGSGRTPDGDAPNPLGRSAKGAGEEPDHLPLPWHRSYRDGVHTPLPQLAADPACGTGRSRQPRSYRGYGGSRQARRRQGQRAAEAGLEQVAPG
jgi:hypothetical protein